MRLNIQDPAADPAAQQKLIDAVAKVRQQADWGAKARQDALRSEKDARKAAQLAALAAAIAALALAIQRALWMGDLITAAILAATLLVLQIEFAKIAASAVTRLLGGGVSFRSWRVSSAGVRAPRRRWRSASGISATSRSAKPSLRSILSRRARRTWAQIRAQCPNLPIYSTPLCWADCSHDAPADGEVAVRQRARTAQLRR